MIRTKRFGIGRAILTQVEIKGQEFLLANIYAPNEDDPVFFAELFSEILDSPIDAKIIGGDFNVILDPEWDRKSRSNKKVEKSRAARLINNFMEEEQWVDVWCTL